MMHKKLCLLVISMVIPMGLRSQETPSRLDKGRAYAGLSFGANFKDANNTEYLGLVNVISEQNSGGNIDVNGGYFLSKYFSLGGTYRYAENNRDAISQDADQVLTHSARIVRSHTSGVYVKYFTPVNAGETINFFARAGISYSDQRSLTEATTSEVLIRTFEKTNKVYFGLVPGVQVIVARGFAIETDVSIAGLQSTWSQTRVNGEPTSDLRSTSVSFDINLLSLNIGFFYYF